MVEFLDELNKKRFAIKDEVERNETGTAGRIAVVYGYTLIGVVELDVAPYPVSLLVSRETNHQDEKYLNAFLRGLKKDGYGLTPVDIVVDNRTLGVNLILGKRYGAGGTMVMDKRPSLDSNPVAMAGYSDGTPVMGFMLDTAPEHWGDAIRIAGLLDMEPKPRIPDVFLDL